MRYTHPALSIVLIIALLLSAPRVMPALAQEPPATPAMMPVLAEFVMEISLGTETASAAAGVAVAADGSLYVIDSLQDQIRVFDRDGNPVATWGESGSGPGQFRFNAGGATYFGDLAIGPDGNLYVVDPFNGRIQVLGPDGAYLREWGEPGDEAGQFDAPSGIGIDSAGRVYVTEFDNRRLQVFAAEGQLLAVWPMPRSGDLDPALADVAVDAIGVASVTDVANDRIYRVDAEGTVVDVFGEQGAQLGQFFSPWGVAVDAAGNLYVAEYGGSRVQVLAPDGAPLDTIGCVREAGQLSNPIALAFGPGGLLYVADEGPRRVQVFRLLPPLGAAITTPISEEIRRRDVSPSRQR